MWCPTRCIQETPVSQLLKDLMDRSESDPRHCAFGKVLESLTEEECEAIKFVIPKIKAQMDLPQHERTLTVKWLHQTFTKNGYKVGYTSVRDHINGGCICDPSE
jgi:hypothetical protein